jgi:hypothetical protein
MHCLYYWWKEYRLARDRRKKGFNMELILAGEAHITHYIDFITNTELQPDVVLDPPTLGGNRVDIHAAMFPLPVPCDLRKDPGSRPAGINFVPHKDCGEFDLSGYSSGHKN